MLSDGSAPKELAGGLVVRARAVENVTVLEFEGEICRDKGGELSLFEHIRAELDRGKKNFIFSFRNLRCLDSYGIGEILASYVSINGVGGKLKFACLFGKVLRVFNVQCITPPWKMSPRESGLHKTVEEALESFAADSSSER